MADASARHPAEESVADIRPTNEKGYLSVASFSVVFLQCSAWFTILRDMTHLMAYSVGGFVPQQMANFLSASGILRCSSWSIGTGHLRFFREPTGFLKAGPRIVR